MLTEKQDKDIFRSVFDFYAKHKNPKPEQLRDRFYWKQVFDEAMQIHARHNCKMCNDMISTVYSELIRNYYERNKSAYP